MHGGALAAVLLLLATTVAERAGAVTKCPPGGLSGGAEKMVVTGDAPHVFTWPECSSKPTESYNYTKHGNMYDPCAPHPPPHFHFHFHTHTHTHTWGRLK